jgi:hypothetical protein
MNSFDKKQLLPGVSCDSHIEELRHLSDSFQLVKFNHTIELLNIRQKMQLGLTSGNTAAPVDTLVYNIGNDYES